MYGKYRTAERGWYRPHLERSLDWILGASKKTDHILDAGGGASALASDLVAHGYTRITVVDLAQTALDEAAQETRSDAVDWIQGDLRLESLMLPVVDVWHDRAVFHFMTTDEERAHYLATMRRSLKRGGLLIVGTFNPDAPPKCSALPVERYTTEELAKVFGPDFTLLEATTEGHTTPGGTDQPYSYIMMRRQ